LSHNLHVKDLRQTRYTKVFLEFHKYLACLPSAAATLRARRGRGPAADAHRARRSAGGGESFLACAHECQTTEVEYPLLRACSTSAALMAAGKHTHVRTHRTSSDPVYLIKSLFNGTF
jgi:hypothetical protein